MISFYKLNTRGKFLFINPDILTQHSVGIDTTFTTMGYFLANLSLVLVQPNIHTTIGKPHVGRPLLVQPKSSH